MMAPFAWLAYCPRRVTRVHFCLTVWYHPVCRFLHEKYSSDYSYFNSKVSEFEAKMGKPAGAQQGEAT